MVVQAEARLKEIGIVLPTPSKPTANYVPTRRSGNLMFVAGQVPRVDGVDHYVGQVGRDITIADAQAAARLCVVNMLAQLKDSLDGDLDRVSGCMRLGGFVNATPDFGDHATVINAASDLIVAVFGEKGRHARAAVGCGSLPRRFAVEVEGIFEVAGP